jgi:hypothetical protein
LTARQDAIAFTPQLVVYHCKTVGVTVMRCYALLCLAFVAVSPELQAREWTDSTGQFRREAEYLSQSEGKVWLRAPDGKTLAVSPDRLSSADRAYLAALPGSASEKLPAAVVPASAPRAPQATSAPNASAPVRLLRSINSAAVARLTGWHCHGGHCYVTHHHPAPLPPPAPNTSTKRRYFGYFSTFHLPRRDVGKLSGTGSYKFLTGSYVVAYLEMLIFNGALPGFSVYAVDQPGPLGITNWYFEDVAPAPGSYRVYYFAPATGVVFYEYACLRNPL